MAKYGLSTPLRKYRDNINELREAIKALRFMKLSPEEREAKASEYHRLIHVYETQGAELAQKTMREARKE